MEYLVGLDKSGGSSLSKITKKEQIIKLYSTTYKSNKDIADAVGVVPSYVTKILAKIDTKAASSNRVSILRERMLLLLISKLEVFAQSDDIKHFYAFCTGLKRLSEMCGLDAPKQVEVDIKNWPSEVEYIVDVEGEVKDG
jgi:DNA-binding CsgD family transcriptional regulator